MLARLKARDKIELILPLLQEDSDWRNKFVQQECIRAISILAAPDVNMQAGSLKSASLGNTSGAAGFYKKKPTPTRVEKKIGGLDDQTRKAITPLLMKKSDDPYLRKEIIGAFITLEDVEARPVIIQALKDPDDKIRTLAISALRVLPQVPSPEENDTDTEQTQKDSTSPFEIYVQSLKDPSPAVRIRSVIGLGASGNEAAIDPLIGALDDKDQEVKNRVVKELGKFENEKILVHLKPLLAAGSYELRSLAVDSFRHVSAKTAQKEVLVQRIRGERNILPEGQPASNGDIKPAFVHPLAVGILLKDFSELNENAKNAVLDIIPMFEDKRIQQLLLKLLKDTLPSLRIRAVRLVYDYFDKKIVKTLSRMMADSNESVRAAVVEALCRFPVSDAHDICLNSLNDSSAGVRSAAASCIQRNPDKKAVDALIRQLDDPSIDLVNASIAALAACRDARVVEPMIKIVDGTFYKTARPNEIFIRRPAITALGVLGDRRAVPALIEARKDKELQRTAVEALANIDDPTILPVLLQDFESSDPATQDAARIALCRMKKPEAILPLLRSVSRNLKKRNSPSTVIADCLHSYQFKTMPDILIQYLDDNDRAVRIGAILVLGEFHPTQKAIDRLTKVMNGPDQEMRLFAEYSLCRLNGKQDSRFFELMRKIFVAAPSETGHAVSPAQHDGAGNQ